MRKLINAPEDVVSDALRGMAAAHPSLRVDAATGVVVRADAPRRGKVALVSGGGSGHEPLHAGFVGPGMLDAACAGEVFTSPTPDRILAATMAVDGGAGVLHVVKNYTGDVLNFRLAAELAEDEGIEVAAVVVADDVAVEDSTYTAGRRGTGGTLFVEKIAGAAAEAGAPLAEVAAVAADVAGRCRSFGVALAPCTVPAAGTPTFELAADEIELGIGIHGEPGRERAKARPAAEIVDAALTAIDDDLPVAGQDVLVLVNGMGGTPLLEQYIAYAAAAGGLAARGATVVRSLVGPYVTSLEMAGLMITVCRTSGALTGLWDAPADTPALRAGAR
ncbi:dihydroxyacetone kinase subunit DhaK [Actinomadura parmotrematis]|uniref:Dihydroxyacetone kinase subunit DhaK n=1 Tax=Actinomadura parmotrematis TaxID=2864039 RepID=A0ABS7G5N1_9ACTN|nr:dihydroxyacetone kinase subunit DhaK [Actinomadura parmotrematis]MBW8486953.1 dihydroxyacetone kinase subunit DhaK [Actinomadura parmotrematis]